jgi:hypothetical protein
MKESRTVESVGDRLGTKLLTFVLSVIAGSVDVIGFLGFGALFIAHITGDLVVLAARTAAGEHASAAHLLSVQEFIIALFAARLLAATLDHFAIATLRPLSLLQFMFLAGFLAVSIEIGSAADRSAAMACRFWQSLPTSPAAKSVSIISKQHIRKACSEIAAIISNWFPIPGSSHRF